MNTTIDSNPGSITTSSSSSITNEISLSTNWNTTLSSISPSTVTLGKNLLYGDNCTEHEECTLSKYLFCEYEFDLNSKNCFCETSYFWNKNTQQCG